VVRKRWQGTNGGLPAIVAQPILGNTWDRTNMMGATKAAYNASYEEQAVDAAACCQIHNGGAHSCLAGNRDLVKAMVGCTLSGETYSVTGYLD
jgi:hypothetical protein